MNNPATPTHVIPAWRHSALRTFELSRILAGSSCDATSTNSCASTANRMTVRIHIPQCLEHWSTCRFCITAAQRREPTLRKSAGRLQLLAVGRRGEAGGQRSSDLLRWCVQEASFHVALPPARCSLTIIPECGGSAESAKQIGPQLTG